MPGLSQQPSDDGDGITELLVSDVGGWSNAEEGSARVHEEPALARGGGHRYAARGP